ncbi:MAG: CHASE2 domain-containing protein, partial [Spirochaetales bacterium]|nr:CHASE2 domain-containing protein [Spirochaetales bacterium]
MKIVLDKKKTVAVIIIVSFIIAYMAGFLFNNQFSLIDAQLNDHFFRLRYMMKKNEAIDHRIVLIAIGDSVFQDRNIPVWDRRIFGKLIDILADAGAASIGIDIVFQDKSYVENDDSLIQAVKNAKNVLSPVILNPSSDKIQENHADEIPGLLVQPHIVVQGDPVIAREDILPFKELLCYSHSLGHINCDADNDGMNRKFPLLIRDGKNKNAYYPGLAFRMVYEHLGVQPDTIDVYFGKKIVLKNAHISGNKIEDIEIPIDHKGRMILNWAGPWYGNTFPNYSVERLLKAANDPVELLKLKKTLEGALVIVANVSTPNNDHGPGVFEKVYPLSGV